MKKAACRGFTAFAAIVGSLLLLGAGGAAPAAAAATGSGRNNCTRSCGGIDISYPFGVEPGCYHAAWFNLTCDLSLQPPKLFLGDGTVQVQVLEISAPNATVRINSSRVEFARRGGGDGRTVNGTWGLGLPRDGPYFLSEDTNMLLVERCDVQAVVRGGVNNSLVASCSSVCPPAYQDGSIGYLVGVRGGCIGIGCCQANIYIGYSFYSIQINKLDGSLFDPGPESTDYTYIVDRGYNYTNSNAPLDEFMPTLNWIIAYNMTCPTNASAPECRSAYSSCLNTVADPGFMDRGGCHPSSSTSPPSPSFFSSSSPHSSPIFP